MGAGHETTASSVSWALFELTRHLDTQDNLRAEIREKIAEKGNSVFSGHDYENMPYLTAVVKVNRTFRLYFPVILVSFSYFTA
jgi:cytochrome P450